MVRPVAPQYPVTLGYRQKANFDPNYIHRGIDYGCPSGTPVVATRGGTVVSGSYGSAYGTHVIVRVGDIWCLYAHLSGKSVVAGQTVATGQRIGTSGATGNVRGAHLHYQENTQPPAAYTSDRNPQFITWTDGPRLATLTVMTANVQGYDKTPNAASLTRCRDLIEASLVFTNETGAYDAANDIYPHADRIARTLGNWGYVCHGPGNFLSNAIYWAPPKYKMLHEGQFTTYGTHHNRATWALLNRLDADTLFIALSTHLEYRPAGSNDSHTIYDDIRQKQTAAALSQAEALAATYAKQYGRTHIPVIFGADCNGDLNDGYDGPGHAFAAAGYVDAERVARVNVNTDKTTYTGTRGFVSGDRLDRLAFEKNTPVLELITQPNSGSDHAAVGATVQLTNGPRP